MSNRPKISIPLTKSDWAIEAICALFVIAQVAILISNFELLRDGVPERFGPSGEITRTGGTAGIILLTFFNVQTYAMMTLLGRFPHAFNFPFPITPENSRVQYTISLRMLRYLKLVCTMLFLYIGITIIESARTGESALNPWIIGTLVSMSIIVPAIGIWFSYQNK